MAMATADFASWIEQADIPQSRLTPEVEALLGAAWRFRQQQGNDYYSTRLLAHFLLHCDCGLKVAQIARLVGISRPNASKQQKLSSKEVIQQVNLRLRGRPYGKLLPRFAGPIAAFLVGHPLASRADLLDFIWRTFGVRVSRIALYKFLKKFGLDHIPTPAPPALPGGASTSPAVPTVASATPAASPPPSPVAPAQAAGPTPRSQNPSPEPPLARQAEVDLPPAILLPGPTVRPPILLPGPALPLALGPAPPFSSRARNMPAPGC